MFSVVITAYNRQDCISYSFFSALSFIACIGGGEIVLVDDASTDSTYGIMTSLADICSSEALTIKTVRNRMNRGVCFSKNIGASMASADWIIFLDSDDYLIPSSAEEVVARITSHPNCRLHFFLSVGLDGKALTSYHRNLRTAHSLDLNTICTTGTGGESLPVISSYCFRKLEYDPILSGFEVSLYSKIVSMYGPAILHPLPARIYSIIDYGERISSASALLRSRRVIPGYLSLLENHATRLDLYSRLYILTLLFFHKTRIFVMTLMRIRG